MLKIYDKAQWHIDGGEKEEDVVAKLKAVLLFLSTKKFLSEEGKEILEFGVDKSISIHERMLTDDGNKFMRACYDKAINKSQTDITDELEVEFENIKD